MTTKDIVKIALFAALTAALGLFPPIDLPVLGAKITAQSLGVMLAGALLGAKRGGLALLLFVALVAAGLPLLAGGRGGLGVLLGPSGGFIFAFPLAAFVTGWLLARLAPESSPLLSLLALIIGGIVVIYALGIPWLSVVAKLPLQKAAFGAMAFLPGDLIKAVITLLIARAVRRAYPAL
ncbi:MAG: biotin transporter BioY [Proteobacteria bacterium]|nr:biotin transporter BioY [Pseudomonadota bacterium]